MSSKINGQFFITQSVTVETGDHSEEYRIYWECEQKCREHTQRLSYFVVFHTLLFPIVLIYALVCIALGDYDTSKWHLTFFVAVPFDQTRVWGWFLTWLIELFMAFSYALCVTTVTSFFVSCCYYIHVMCDHCNVLINLVPRTVGRLQTEVRPQKIKKIRQQINNQLCNVIKFQIKIYE